MASTLRKIGTRAILFLASLSMVACPDTTWLSKIQTCTESNECNAGLVCCANLCQTQGSCSGGDALQTSDATQDTESTDTPSTSDTQSGDTADGDSPLSECVKLTLVSSDAVLTRSYHVCPTPRTYDGAKAACEGLGNGSKLFVPETTFERGVVFGAMVGNQKIDQSEINNIWLGISAEDALSVCDTGCNKVSEPIPLEWAEGQPAVSDGACVSLAKNGFNWSIEDCNSSESQHPFVCESDEPYNACGTDSQPKDPPEYACAGDENCSKITFGSGQDGYRCCATGYNWSVDECVPMNNPCSDNPDICEEGGTCAVTGDVTYLCNCPPGFIDDGTKCSKATDCGEGNKDSVQHCGENGECKSLADGTGYTCICADGYVNAADLDDGICLPDVCPSVDELTCSEYGSCEMIDNTPTCICGEAVAVPNDKCICPAGTEAVAIDDTQKTCVYVAPPDCSSISPESKSGYYLIDPNGSENAPGPLLAWCDLEQEDGDGKGWTQIAFNEGEVLFDKDVYQDGWAISDKGAPTESDELSKFFPKSYAFPCAMWQKLEETLEHSFVVRVTMLAQSDNGLIKTSRVDYFRPNGTNLCGMLLGNQKHQWWWNGMAYVGNEEDSYQTPVGMPGWEVPKYVGEDGQDDKQSSGYGGSQHDFSVDRLGRAYLNFWGSNGKVDTQKGGCCTNTEGIDEETIEWGLPFEISFKVVNNLQVDEDPTP